MDVAVKDIENHAFPQFNIITNKLSNGGSECIQQLGWTVKSRPQQAIRTSLHTIDPYRLAEENKYYPFKTARQFTRAVPFVLIFAYSAQFSRLLHANFGGSTDITL